MGRTREELIQGRTGAIIDASRQNSRIQGSTYLDDSSARLDAHFSSCVGRARERGGETKTPSMSTRDTLRRPIVDNSSTAAKLESFLRWAPPEAQVETWECRVVTSRLPVSDTVVLAGGCEVMVCKPSPERFLSHLGLGNILGGRWGGHRCFAPKIRGFGSFGWLCGEEQLLAALVSSVDWVARGTYRTAWAVSPRCCCSYAYGLEVAVGPQTGERSGSCSEVCGGPLHL